MILISIGFVNVFGEFGRIQEFRTTPVPDKIKILSFSELNL